MMGRHSEGSREAGALEGQTTDRPSPADAAAASQRPDAESQQGILEQGIRLLSAGKNEPARRCFLEVLRQQPSHVEARVRLAMTYLADRDYTRARMEAGAALAEDPEHVRALCTLMEVHLREDDQARARLVSQRAVRAFHRLVAGERAVKEDLVCLVRALAALEDDHGLALIYRRYVRSQPSSWDGLTLARLGTACFNLGRYQEARWLWRRAQQDRFMQDVMAVFLHALELVESQAVPPFRMDYSLGMRDYGVVSYDPPGCVKAFALYTLWRSDDEESREAALDLLAQSDDLWAEAFLQRFLCLPHMPDALKLKAGGWMLERGFIDSRSPVAMHIDGQLREVMISTEPGPEEGELPPGNQALSAAANPDAPCGNGPEAAPPSQRKKRERVRQRELWVHPGMAWEDGLERLTKARLLTIARTLGLQRVSGLRKVELVQHLARWLKGNWGLLLQRLPAEEQEVLKWIAAQGGVVAHRRLLERYGHRARSLRAAGDGEALHERLEGLGLLFIGRMERRGGGQRVAVIPREMREALMNGRPEGSI